jgi:hypothetical protein
VYSRCQNFIENCEFKDVLSIVSCSQTASRVALCFDCHDGTALLVLDKTVNAIEN